MGQVVRAPLYVPKAPEEALWIGRPKATALVLLTALVPTFFLAPTKQIRPAEEIGWTGSRSPRLSIALQSQPLFTAKGTQRFDYVPETGWLGEPSVTSNVLYQLPAQPPFTSKSTRRFDYVPEPGWLGRPIPVSATITISPVVVLPFSNPRRFDVVPEPGWLGEPSVTSNVLYQLPAQPPFTAKGTRRFDYVPEPGWLGQPEPVSTSILLPPSVAQPFSNPRRFDLATDIPGFKSIPFAIPLAAQAVLPFQNIRRFEHVPVPDWVKGGGSIPQALLQLPAAPPFTVKGTRHFDHVPEPGWLGEPVPASLIYTLLPQAVLPFNNRPRQGQPQFYFVPEPGWLGKPTAYPLSFALPPAVPPFTVKGTRHFEVPDFVPWSQHGTRSGTIYLPALQPVQVIRNVITRVRVLSNERDRVRVVLNENTRYRIIKNIIKRSDE